MALLPVLPLGPGGVRGVLPRRTHPEAWQGYRKRQGLSMDDNQVRTQNCACETAHEKLRRKKVCLLAPIKLLALASDQKAGQDNRYQ